MVARSMETTKQQEPSGTAATIAGTTIILVFIVGVIVPIILTLLMWLTPDTTRQTGDGGMFVSASTSAGGFLSLPVTSIQTSNGTIVVVGAFSGMRGQRLRIRDGIKSGLQLCVEESTASCSDMAGLWTGRLVPVPYRRGITDWIPLYIGARALSLWLLIGFFATIVVGIAAARISGWDSYEGKRESSESGKASP